MATTPKQRKFVDEYLVDFNGTQAAIRAGFSKRTANEQASRMLAKVNIQEYLQERRRILQENTEITPERVMLEYAKLAFANIRDAVEWSPDLGQVLIDGEPVATNGVLLKDSKLLSDSVASAVAEVASTRDGIKIKMHDKKGALDSIARTLGMFNDRVAATVDAKVDAKVTVSAPPALSVDEWLTKYRNDVDTSAG